MTTQEIDIIYGKVLIMVEKGCSISSSILSTGITRTQFYRNITTEQRRELKTTKILNAKVGSQLKRKQ